jgi:hypothetical protein
VDDRLTAGALPVDGDAPEITIVLADDHAVVRHGLRLLLEAEEDIEVVAEAGDVDAAQRFVLGHAASHRRATLPVPMCVSDFAG